MALNNSDDLQANEYEAMEPQTQLPVWPTIQPREGLY